MQSIEQEYEGLLQQKDLQHYKQMKHKLELEQKLATNLLEISCDLTIFNDDEINKQKRIKIAQDVLKNMFKVVNVCKIQLEPQFKATWKFEVNEQVNINSQHINLIYQRRLEEAEIINKQNELNQLFNVKSNQTLYRQAKQGKIYFMITQENIQPDVVSHLFYLSNSQSSKLINQAVLNIAGFVANSFEKKYAKIISQYFEIQFTSNLSGLIIKGNPLATLLVSKLCIDHQRMNSVYKRAIFLSKTMKSPNRMIMFYKGHLLYSNHEYLSNNLKKMIEDRTYPTFETVIQQLQYSLKQHTQILLKYKVIGYHQSSSKKWTMIVDRQWIQFTFQIQPARRLGIINKQQKGYLDLFTSGQQINNQNGNKKAFKISIMQTEPEQNIKQILEIKFKQLEASKHIDQFEFNILDYDPEVAGILSFDIIITRFPTIDIDKTKLQQFIRKIGYLYQMHNNTFHNIYHMFTVLHGAYIMSKCDIFTQLFDIQTTFTYLVGALCHDIAHTGVTNFFEQKIQSRLANRFGDKSILQSNSIAQALKLLSNQSTNFLINFPEKTWRSFRKLFVSGILATDNKNHMAVFTDFQSATKEKAPLDSDSIHKLIGGLLHTVDFWGNIKNFKASYDWSKRVNQEFSKQYQKQVQLGIQLTPYFKDLNIIKVIAKNQQLFTSAIISPLYRRVNEWTEGYVSLAIERITTNTEKWKEVETGAQQIQFFLQ